METPKMHPMMWVATVAVTLFSLVGIGAITGIIPKAGSEATPPKTLYSDSTPSTPGVAPIPQAVTANAPAAAPQPTSQSSQPAGKAAVLAPPPAPTAIAKPAAMAENIPQPSKPKAAPHAPASSRPATAVTAPKPALYGPPADALPAPSNAAPPPAPVVHQVCRDCGVIETIRGIQSQGQSTGIGAIAGGILGGVLGNQVGGGHGREVATVAGAVAGGLAGNQIERNQHTGANRYQTVVRFEDGTTQLFTEDGIPAWRIGQKVKVEGGLIIPR